MSGGLREMEERVLVVSGAILAEVVYVQTREGADTTTA